MIETHHTPGPWQLAQDGSIGSIETASGQVPIGQSFQTRPIRRAEDHMERIANARLMAAAPELLEALQRLSAQCERLRMAWQLESDAERTARVVIAKAIGGAE